MQPDDGAIDAGNADILESTQASEAAKAAETTQAGAIERTADIEGSGKVRQAIVYQLQKLENDTDLTSASDFRMAQRWENINNTLGLTTVIVSGLVTVLGAAASVQGTEQINIYFIFISTVLASVATAIGSVLTFLKPSERGGRYREFGNKQKALRNRIRVYRSVLMLQESSMSKASEQLIAFGIEKDTLNSDNPPVPRFAFIAAESQLKEKEAQRASRMSHIA